MIIGFSKHGRGDGDAPVGYLTEGMATAVPYLTGKSRQGVPRNPPPVVLRGDPGLTRKLINQVQFTRRYTSGVLSFSERTVKSEVETDIMDRFEAVAFAGLSKDRYTMLWVRHTHVGRHEMHFLTPAIDWGTGKALNINPPRQSTRETFDTLRRLINDQYGLTDPDDPSRARSIRVPRYPTKGSSTRDSLRREATAYLEAKVRAGVIKTRDDVLRLLRDGGYTVSRAGKDYLTVVGQAGERCRLKGALLKGDFRLARETAPPGRLSTSERAEMEAKLARLVAVRAEFNQRRYRLPALELESLAPPSRSPHHHESEEAHDRTRTSFDERAPAFDHRIAQSGRTLDRALERSGESARRWRDAASELEQRALDTGRARESLERASRGIAGGLNETVRRFQERSVSAALCRKYGARAMTFAREEEQVLELEREAYASSV